MSEQQVITQSTKPNTVNSLTFELQKLGIRRGDILLVHASMKSLGWVSGGPQAVIEALMDTLTDQGTLIFQTHSPTLSDPAEWENPPVPEKWHQTIRDTMPAFDLDKTPSTYLGVLPELFRKFPNVHRSHHPTFSMSAWGKYAREITAQHDLHYSLSDTSPLGQAYEKNAKILLLGVGYDSNTSFHLSEYRSATRDETTKGAPLLQNGRTEWTTYADIKMDDDPFENIGATFEKQHEVIKGKVGMADVRLFSMRESVDFATNWLKSDALHP